jgi:putative transcriptional regulator
MILMKMKLEEHIRQSGLKKSHIAKELGISGNTLANWINSRSYPPLDKAVKLANMLGVDLKDTFTNPREYK